MRSPYSSSSGIAATGSRLTLRIDHALMPSAYLSSLAALLTVAPSALHSGEFVAELGRSAERTRRRSRRGSGRHVKSSLYRGNGLAFATGNVLFPFMRRAGQLTGTPFSELDRTVEARRNVNFTGKYTGKSAHWPSAARTGTRTTRGWRDALQSSTRLGACPLFAHESMSSCAKRRFPGRLRWHVRCMGFPGAAAQQADRGVALS